MSNGNKVAIVGIGSSVLARDSGRSVGALACDAVRAAILDSGVPREAINGVSGIYSTDQPTVWPGYIVESLGLSDVVWSTCSSPPSGNTVAEGVLAVAAGACEYAVCYHAKYRWDTVSAAARKDPYRKAPKGAFDPAMTMPLVEPVGVPNGMFAAMRRHMHDYGTRRDHLGMIVVNNRSWALFNDKAIFRDTPLSLADYLAAPEIASPLTALDMDMPIDGAMAVVITTAERAADLPHRPVLVEASANAIAGKSDFFFQAFDTYASYKTLIQRLWNTSGYSIDDMDFVNIYDGFSSLALEWIEAAFDVRGEAAGFLEDSWVPAENRLKFKGRIPMSTHGGNLGEGRVQGFGHVLEAVRQLRGDAGPRQLLNPQLGLVTNGNNPVNAGFIFRAG
ncbi:MAG: Acetyl-CoA acetyltransferase [Sphingomonadales bacterium]|nr:Acetyl-CoA acetyltransferase [Sphingomonadales bacterium]